jgi:NAD(P)-dependent dehydrogenase (short-subunit alcohol dehydrogenase family)
MSSLQLTGELVLVSGAAGGLGRPICRRLAGLGASVVAVDVLGEPVPPLGTAVCYERADVADPDETEALLDRVQDRFGRPPGTVCCHAGMVEAHGILEYPLDAFDRQFRANVRTAFVLAQAAARRWRAAGLPGHLIFTSSWVQDHPWPEIAPYCASKAALHSLMRSFAKELASFDIRANAVLPGIVSAGMARRQWDEDESYRRRARQTIALGSLQDPESVADAFAFLCSDLASYMTGSVLRVDGGCSLGGPA